MFVILIVIRNLLLWAGHMTRYLLADGLKGRSLPVWHARQFSSGTVKETHPKLVFNGILQKADPNVFGL